jgi:hypothetical protein
MEVVVLTGKEKIPKLAVWITELVRGGGIK